MHVHERKLGSRFGRNSWAIDHVELHRNLAGQRSVMPQLCQDVCLVALYISLQNVQALLLVAKCSSDFSPGLEAWRTAGTNAPLSKKILTLAGRRADGQTGRRAV
jgi:hypothetical protein